jgi:hypothetical protein
MVVAETEHSTDALSDWAEEITRYDDLRPALASARARGSVSGTRLLVAGHPSNESAVAQRVALAEAVAKELEALLPEFGPAHLVVFDTFWVPDTVINRSRGANRLLERASRKYDVVGRVADSDSVSKDAAVRWAAVLELDQSRLPNAISAVERDEAALLFPSRGMPKAAGLLHDLFADADDGLTTRTLGPLWVSRRASAGDAVLLAKELNDHSGRVAFLLMSPDAHGS